MSVERLNSESRPLHFLTLNPMKRKEQVVINDDFGIRICRIKSELAPIEIVLPNCTEISFSASGKLIRPQSSDSIPFVRIPFLMAKGEKVMFGGYKLKAFVREKTVILNIEARKPLKRTYVDKDQNLRILLSNLSLEDNHSLQL